MLQTAFGRICAIEIDAVQVANWGVTALSQGKSMQMQYMDLEDLLAVS